MRALSKVFRAKFLEGLRRAFDGGKLGDDAPVPMLSHTLRNRDWVVYAKPPFAGPESVLSYLGAYTHRIAISNARIRSIEHGRVTFQVRDSADANRQKVMQLTEREFIRRFLLHVLPKGFHRIRHYGLFASASRKANLARARELLGAPKPEQVSDDTLKGAAATAPLCPCCGGRMIVVETFERGGGPRAPPPEPAIRTQMS